MDKPVAWMYTSEDGRAQIEFMRSADFHDWTETPLYDHPAVAPASEQRDALIADLNGWIGRANDAGAETMIVRVDVLRRCRAALAAPVAADAPVIQTSQWGRARLPDEIQAVLRDHRSELYDAPPDNAPINERSTAGSGGDPKDGSAAPSRSPFTSEQAIELWRKYRSTAIPITNGLVIGAILEAYTLGAASNEQS